MLKIGKRVKCRGIRGTITAYIPAHDGYMPAWSAVLDGGIHVMGSRWQFQPVRRVRRIK